MTQKSQRLDITMPAQVVKEIDLLVKKSGYASRSEILRAAFRKLYVEHLRDEAAKLLPADYDSVKGVRELKNRRWKKALSRAKGDIEKAKDIVMRESDTLQ